MIWNYYNIIRNLIFLCFIFIFYCIFFTTEAKTQSPMKICDSTNKGWKSTNNDTCGTDICTTKCSDLKVAGTGYPRGVLTTNGEFGLCAGKATASPLEIYKIALGTASGGFNGSDKCTIFEGKIVTDFAKAKKGQTVGRGDIVTSSCSPDKSYDRVYFYINRFQSFAGQTVFPGDNTGTVARTRAPCTDNDTTVTNTSWLDGTNLVSGKWNSLTKCYGAPTGWSTSIYVKADPQDLLTSVSSASNSLITYDDFKIFFVNGVTPDSDGFYKESGPDGDYLGVKVDPEDINKNIYVIKNGSDIISGLPLTFNKPNKKLSIKISYYSANRDEKDDNETIGVVFLFRKNGSNAELAGYLSGDNGLFFKFSSE